MKGFKTGSRIRVVIGREVLTHRGPAVEATVLTEDGVSGTSIAMAGLSFGKYEVSFVYDGGKRYDGKGVLKAVKNINEIIAPALRGIVVTEQRKIDETIISLDGTEKKSKLGGNATASVSSAALKAAARSLGVPLYRHIGGKNARILPVPTVLALTGSRRYGGGERAGGKPFYEFVCYGFKTLSEAICVGQYVQNEFRKIIRERFHIFKFKDTFDPAYNFIKDHFTFLRNLPYLVKRPYLAYLRAFRGEMIPRGKVESDREIWEAMTKAISRAGYENKVGILVDVAAGCYYDNKKDKFVGLFSKEDKTGEDLIEIYEDMVATYPFVILEDPLDEEDFEGHAILTKKLHIEVVGDDLFAMRVKRVQKGIETGACNAILMRVTQAGTVTEALDIVRLAYENDYGVLPCGSRGEGVDIVDFAVGLCTGQMKGGGVGESANRLVKIEEDFGSQAKFLGKDGLKSESRLTAKRPIFL